MSATARVLVAGASGFIGRCTLQPLVQRGFAVHALARHALPGCDVPGVQWHVGDLFDGDARRRILAEVRPTHLLHLAWTVEHGRFWTAPDNLDWVAVSLMLAREFMAGGGQRLVGAGTCSEYDWSHALLDEHATPLRPATLYGTAKHALHSVLAKACSDAGVSCAWGRVFFLHGPHEAPQRLVPSVILALLRGEDALCSHGRQVRDFLHVADAGAAFAALLASDVTGPVNIAAGETHTVAEVARFIGDALGSPRRIRLGARPAPPDDPPRLAATAAILREQVGFTPRYGFHDGLQATIDWWRRHAAQLERAAP